MALVNATEGAARSTVLKVTQVKPSHGFVPWQALVDGCAPKSSSDPAIALSPIPATPTRCKDAKERKERLTAWSLKVDEHEHQSKAVDEAQKTHLVREMMPKDIKREFLTGPRKFDAIMEKLEIIINEMMADDGPVPMDQSNVGTHDAKTAHCDSDTSNGMPYGDVCAIAFIWCKADKGTGKKGQNGLGAWHLGKGADEWTSGSKDERRAPRAAKLTCTVTRTKEALESKAKARARTKPDTATIADSKGISE